MTKTKEVAKARGRSGPTAPTPAKKSKREAATLLKWSDFLESRFSGDRVLSCGEGDQLGHPGRTTTKKPRAVDTLPEDVKIRQVVAGGVHSLLLSTDGRVFTCGVNEKGTVPAEGVEAESSTDKFTPINFDEEVRRIGRIVQLAAGASFSAAVTEEGAVVVWGNLRDSSGCIETHKILQEMQKKPVVIVDSEHEVVKVAAGENHLAMLTSKGQVLTFGEGAVGQLGRCARPSLIRAIEDKGNTLKITVLERGRLVSFKNVWAAGYWTIVQAKDNRVFAFGLNNFSQLGVDMPSKEDQEGEPNLSVALPKQSPQLSGKEWTHLDGVQHVVGRTVDGDVFALGKNTDNALGLGTWTGQNDEKHWKYETLQPVRGWDGAATGVTARLASSIVWTESGEAWAWGCDTTGQLGLGIKDDDDQKVVPQPRLITSAHLEGHEIVQASLGDTHALFLAKKSKR